MPRDDANIILIVFLFMSLLVYFILFICEFFVCVCFPNKGMNELSQTTRNSFFMIHYLKYLPIMGLRLDAILYSKLGTENSDADHVKCSRGPHLARWPQVPDCGGR